MKWTPRKKKVLGCLGFSVGLPLVLIIGAVILIRILFSDFFYNYSDLPSDAELIRSFEENREAYETLVTMILEEKNSRVSRITRDPEPPREDPPNRRSITIENLIEDGALSQERLDKYRTLLGEIQTIERVDRGGYEIVWFRATYVGWVGDSMEKGIAYRRPEPEPLFESFDEFPDDLEPNRTGFRKIEDTGIYTSHSTHNVTTPVGVEII